MSSVDSLFKTAPMQQSRASKLKDEGAARSKVGRRPRAEEPKKPIATNDDALDSLPELPPSWMRLRDTAVEETVDPDREYRDLRDALRLTEALTPGNLEAALNNAEDNARRAYRLYVCARVQAEVFETEMAPVVDAMREAANKDLQEEKSRGERSKAITDADVKGRAYVLFPDEWQRTHIRRVKTDAMMDTLKHFAELWKQRCYSLSALLHSGKR